MWSNVILIAIAAIIVAAIYYAIQPKKSREQFALDVEQDYRAAIMRTFNTVLGRDPQEYEVQLYRGYMTSPYDTQQVEIKLLASAEYSNRKGATAIGSATSHPLVEIAASTDPSALIVSNNKAPAITDAVAELASAPPAGINADASVASMDLGQRLAVYRSILTVYESNLDRLPTMKELNYYTAKLVVDDTFTISKLTQIIQSSQEYDILQKNQTNVVNGELPGAITDVQLTLMVNTIYADMFDGAQPTKTFEEFAKAKFVEYQLDETKFRNMLATIHAIDTGAALPALSSGANTSGANTPIANTPIANTSGANTSGANTSIANTSIANTSIANTSGANNSSGTNRSIPINNNTIAPISNNAPLNNANIKRFTVGQEAKEAETKQDYQVVVLPNPDVKPVLPPTVQPQNNHKQQQNAGCDIASTDAGAWQPYMRGNLCSASEAYNKDKFFDSLYTNIQHADAKQCTASVINSVNSSTANGRNRLAETFVDREKAAMGYECSRSELLLNTDPAYSYDPNIVPHLRNTRFGTFLDDANNTKVGSILPKFIYKEYGYVN